MKWPGVAAKIRGDLRRVPCAVCQGHVCLLVDYSDQSAIRDLWLRQAQHLNRLCRLCNKLARRVNTVRGKTPVK